MTAPIRLLGYPKSGNHLAISLLERSGYTVEQTHELERFDRVDLHVVRDPRDIAISAIAHFVLGRPETNPEALRPHVLEVARSIRDGWRGLPGWLDYVRWAARLAADHVVFEDLVADPVGSMRAVGYDVTHGARLVERDVGELGGPLLWRTMKYRSGRPGEWRTVVDCATGAALNHLLRRELVETGYGPPEFTCAGCREVFALVGDDDAERRKAERRLGDRPMTILCDTCSAARPKIKVRRKRRKLR